jgi:hypothetical protein
LHVIGDVKAIGSILSGDVNTLYHPSAGSGDVCGKYMASGDFNGDGLEDVVMGCDDDDHSGMTGAGSVVVFLRNSTDNGFEVGTILIHPDPQNNDLCGAVAAGDVNGDGRDDVIMGCYGDDKPSPFYSASGSAIVFTRNTTNDGFDTGVVLYHPAPNANDYCGFSVASGDVNADGKDDVIMGCTGDDDTNGTVVVLTRNATNDGFDTGVVLTDPSAGTGSNCGISVAAGLINSDNKTDVIMGCYRDDNTSANQGSAVVFIRNATNNGFETAVLLYHPSPQDTDYCGESVASGDVNGDGKDDVIMACPGDEGGSYPPYLIGIGTAVVFTRNASDTGFDTGMVLYHPNPNGNDQCGDNPDGLASGDVNGDGKDDVILGCIYNDNSIADQGSAVVFIRNATNNGFDSGMLLYHPSPTASDRCGYGMAAGDVNGNGKADVVLGCYLDDSAALNAGSAVVIEGASYSYTFGSFGIGTEAPSSALEVRGGILADYVTFTCPPGMTDMGSYFIHTTERTTCDFWECADLCSNYTARMCTPAEWGEACYAGVGDTDDGDWEHVDDVDIWVGVGTGTAIMGNPNCNSVYVNVGGSSDYPCRCCTTKQIGKSL